MIKFSIEKGNSDTVIVTMEIITQILEDNFNLAYNFLYIQDDKEYYRINKADFIKYLSDKAIIIDDNRNGIKTFLSDKKEEVLNNSKRALIEDINRNIDKLKNKIKLNESKYMKGSFLSRPFTILEMSNQNIILEKSIKNLEKAKEKLIKGE